MKGRRVPRLQALRPLMTLASLVPLVSGCVVTGSSSLGGLFVPTADEEVQMLNPRRHEKTCRTVTWTNRGDEGEALSTAMDRLLAKEPEANALANMRITWRVRDFVVARRECVVVTADVVRRIRVIRLPSAGHAH